MILLALSLYLPYKLSYRDVEGLLAERGMEVTTDLAAPMLRVVDELLPDVLHDTEQHSNNRIENDHGRLKARLRPVRGLRTDRTASVVINRHAFMQNFRRGHYELGVTLITRREQQADSGDDQAAE